MIRFHCPLCNKTLEVPEDRGGSTVTCSRCQEPSVVPSESSLEEGQPGRPSARAARRARGVSRGRSVLLRGAVVLVVGVGLLSLVLALAAPFLGASPDFTATIRDDAMLVVPACLVITLALLYAVLTSCPSCGKCWARAEGETAYLGREVSDLGGVRHVRSTQQTNYHCKYCGYAWSMTSTDEYEGSPRDE